MWKAAVIVSSCLTACLSTRSSFARHEPVLPVSCSLMRSTLWLAHDRTVRHLTAYRHAFCLCFWMRWMGLAWRRWRGEGQRKSSRLRVQRRITHRNRFNNMQICSRLSLFFPSHSTTFDPRCLVNILCYELFLLLDSWTSRKCATKKWWL